MDQKVTGWIDVIISTLVAWGNKLFEFFGLYTSKYASWMVIAIIILVSSKIFKIKLNVGGGGR